MLDIDIGALERLDNNALVSYNAFNLFSFQSKDHFGKHDDFRQNVRALLRSFGLEATPHIRFVTLPRMLGFVFNPISLLILCDGNTLPVHLLAEVHNYNGGRTVYNVPLEGDKGGTRMGKAAKEMYVSPFFEREGEYAFALKYDQAGLSLNIRLDESGRSMLNATLNLEAQPYRTAGAMGLFLRHTLLTAWVVTRTLWQSFRLWRKGLQWHSPIGADQIRRY